MVLRLMRRHFLPGRLYITQPGEDMQMLLKYFLQKALILAQRPNKARPLWTVLVKQTIQILLNLLFGLVFIMNDQSVENSFFYC